MPNDRSICTPTAAVRARSAGIQLSAVSDSVVRVINKINMLFGVC